MKKVISTEQIPMIECACGCGTIIKSIDNYAFWRILKLWFIIIKEKH